jgi:hypothetical protein
MATAEGNLDDDDDVRAERRSKSKAPNRDRPRKRRAPVEEEDDEIAVFSGRFVIAAVIILAGSVLPMSKLGEYMEPPGPETTPVDTWGVGVKSTVRITLVTADYNLLGCAAEQSFEGIHCAYKSTNEIWPRDPAEPYEDNNNRLNIIQPYRTWFDNKLVFVSGLWATPEVAYRLHREPPIGVVPEKLARFAVECQLTFLGQLQNAKLRWSPQQSWTDPDGPAWVGKAETCKLIDEPQ